MSGYRIALVGDPSVDLPPPAPISRDHLRDLIEGRRSFTFDIGGPATVTGAALILPDGLTIPLDLGGGLRAVDLGDVFTIHGPFGVG